MNELLFYDKVLKTHTPLMILVLGPEGAGKRTFTRMLKSSVKGFKVEHWREFTMDYNICIDAPSVDALDLTLRMNVFTHIFYIDAGHRVDKTGYPIKLNPDRMVMVDNAYDMLHLEEEVEFCIEMMDPISYDKFLLLQEAKDE